MNPTKARDFFSARYEDSLEPGLKQAFDRALQSDPQIGAEYREFVAVMRHLDVLRAEAVEVPYDLHDRVTARLDLHLHERSRQRKAPWYATWRLALVGGVAVLSLVGALMSVQQRPSDVSTASPVPVATAQGPRLTLRDGTVHLQYRAAGRETVTIRTGDGRVIDEIVLNRQTLDSPVRNPRPEATLVEISFPDRPTPIRVALPGTAPMTPTDGEGNARDLALLIAGTLRMPVELAVEDLDRVVPWALAGADDRTKVEEGVGAAGLRLEERAGGILYLTD